MVVANVKKPTNPAKQAVVAEGRVVGKPGVVVGAKAAVPVKEEQRRRRRLLGKCCVLVVVVVVVLYPMPVVCQLTRGGVFLDVLLVFRSVLLGKCNVICRSLSGKQTPHGPNAPRCNVLWTSVVSSCWCVLVGKCWVFVLIFFFICTLWYCLERFCMVHRTRIDRHAKKNGQHGFLHRTIVLCQWRSNKTFVCKFVRQP